ncbi:uncharacterized protein B0I36DRAFT_139335 [Microdochium trichocladiopsis]|uniref:Uncharacterized protein n=1 Tax=Microdochium trichocladiopsis TaxID=1682393 RepID=A0A9P8Y4N4_9PEZI|nr:uncharacterized protein B0I36DRAFT_139335 [Microdochium trichocladiopsis]KAH7027501.1 hypothetical protein B0I36DRAFT_139335 [Microdochium trichocladiopsis]
MGGLVTMLLAANPGSRSSMPSASSMTADLDMPYSDARQSHFSHKARRPSLDSIVAPTPSPSTTEEWRKAIVDVKLKYESRKYRACSARCAELLSNMDNLSIVEPIYLVSLHFYAAVSLETCARPLSPSSKFRNRLLRDARHHYDQAEALIKKAEDITIQQTRSPSAQSTASSTQAPDLCHDAHSEGSTGPSSPRSSVGSIDGVAKRGKLKPKKKVSFSGLPDLEIEIPNDIPAEPYIRPDSPTLGMEDSYTWGKPGNTPMEVAPKPEAFPMPPKMVPAKKTSMARPASPSILVKRETNIETPDSSTVAQVESLNRMCAHISALRSQIAFHRNAVDTLLAMPQGAEVAPEVPPLPLGRTFLPLASGASTPRYSPGGTFFQADEDMSDHHYEASPPQTPGFHSRASSESTSTFSPGPPRASSSLSIFNPLLSRPGTATSLRRRADSAVSNYSSGGSTNGDNEALRERIERLRANGWKRKRFDPKKYEALRESVLDELDNRGF